MKGENMNDKQEIKGAENDFGIIEAGRVKALVRF